MRPYTTALHRIVWGYVSRRPGLTSVERIGGVEMPDAVETICRPVPRRRRAIEGHARAGCIACYRSGIKCVLYCIDCADIIDVLPRLAMVGRRSEERRVGKECSYRWSADR